MNRISVLIATGLTVALVPQAWAQNDGQAAPFKDVPMTHWAYQAVENLRLKGILRGYADASYRGKRTITRFEMAEALNRILAQNPLHTDGQRGEPGLRGPKGERGQKGEPGPRGIAPAEVGQLRASLDEMRNELGSIRRQIDAADQRADSLTGQIRDLKKHASPVGTGK